MAFTHETRVRVPVWELILFAFLFTCACSPATVLIVKFVPSSPDKPIFRHCWNTSHHWFSGIIPRCHRGDPGSIPGWCNTIPISKRSAEGHYFRIRVQSVTIWPSGLRRQFKALVFTGVGSNPTWSCKLDER